MRRKIRIKRMLSIRKKEMGKEPLNIFYFSSVIFLYFCSTDVFIFFLFFFCFENIFFYHIIHSDHIFPSLYSPSFPHSPIPSSPPIHSTSVSLQKTFKRTKQGKTKHNETRKRPSHQSWTRAPNRRKRVSGAGKKLETHLLQLLQVP